MASKHKSSLNDLVQKINALKRKPIAKVIKKRMKEFEELGKKGTEEWFSELCFCILTANCKASVGIRIQQSIKDGFLKMREEDLLDRLKRFGYRFPTTRTEYICKNRRFWNIKEDIEGMSDRKAREWIVKHVIGLGWKEASHFLRNVGYKDVAIIDRHILRLMEKCGMIPKVPNSMNRRFYLEYEQRLEKVAEKVNMSLAELDLYLWYMQKGEVLK